MPNILCVMQHRNDCGFPKTPIFSVEFPNTVISADNMTICNSEYPLVGSVYTRVIWYAQCTPCLKPPTYYQASLSQSLPGSDLKCPIRILQAKPPTSTLHALVALTFSIHQTTKLLSLLQLSKKMPLVQPWERQSIPFTLRVPRIF